MIERTTPASDSRCVSDGAADVLLGAAGGVREIVAERETGRDRRRERAPSAVGVAAVDAWRAEFMEAVSVEQQIDHFLSRAPSTDP